MNNENENLKSENHSLSILLYEAQRKNRGLMLLLFLSFLLMLGALGYNLIDSDSHQVQYKYSTGLSNYQQERVMLESKIQTLRNRLTRLEERAKKLKKKPKPVYHSKEPISLY